MQQSGIMMGRDPAQHERRLMKQPKIEKPEALLFTIQGPFGVAQTPHKRHAGEYWYGVSEADKERYAKVKAEAGCYVFAMYRSRSKRLIPIYVGKTVNSFAARLFAPDHRTMLTRALSGKRGVSLRLFVLPASTKKGPKANMIGEAEGYLISELYALNPALMNDRKTPKQRWIISGVTKSGRGKPSAASAAFNQMWD